jgi:hypothetical protein
VKNGRYCFLAFIVMGLATSGFAQKIKIGYDKSADFSKYKTYTWAKPETPVTRPLLYENLVGTIDDDLKAKGLQRTEKDGDLTLIAAGGIGFGYNLPATPYMDRANWSGVTDPAILTAPLVAEGTLVLEFIDRGANKMIWRGRATENLDPEQKEKSLTRIEKTIVKLLKGYPPKRSSK